MRLYFQAAFLLTLVLAPFAAWATETSPILIKGSGSPDGRKDIILVEDDANAGFAAGTAKVREVKTGKIVGSFAWSGFGVHPTEESFKVLWRPDSRRFAINWEQTRGFVTCAVYTQSRNGWRQIKLPDLGKRSLKLARAAGKTRVTIGEIWGGKGHEIALAWLPNNHLRIETGYRGMDSLDAKGDWQQLFWFTLEAIDDPRSPESEAVLKDAGLAPLSAYHHPERPP